MRRVISPEGRWAKRACSLWCMEAEPRPKVMPTTMDPMAMPRKSRATTGMACHEKAPSPYHLSTVYSTMDTASLSMDSPKISAKSTGEMFTVDRMARVATGSVAEMSAPKRHGSRGESKLRGSLPLWVKTPVRPTAVVTPPMMMTESTTPTTTIRSTVPMLWKKVWRSIMKADSYTMGGRRTSMKRRSEKPMMDASGSPRSSTRMK
mmetsp:Transcript_364/g.940  ORF Transcript_364/g.940 Transcript_364/m.940 type:complete len:206 (-) Transcript_364:165-782(-)